MPIEYIETWYQCWNSSCNQVMVEKDNHLDGYATTLGLFCSEECVTGHACVVRSSDQA